MSRLLINKNDFIGFKQLSKGRDVDTIETFIQEAQDLDLKELVCREFYFDILKNYQEQAYQKLIHGETYTDADGNDIEFKGLKAVLVHFTYARYTLRSHVTDTPFGMVQKTNEFSQPVSTSEKREIRDRAIVDANRYWEECKIYLDEKVSLFPKWKNCADCGCNGGKSGNGSGILKVSVI